MKIRPFKLERFFARYEFSVRYNLCASDPESMSLAELLALDPSAAERLSALRLGYTESRGAPSLRAAIANLYARTPADRILVHSGAEEPIFTFFNCALASGDHVVVQFPAYESLVEVARAVGAEVTLWRGDAAAGWRFDVDALAAILRDDTRAIVINSPHNPTGALLGTDELQRIVALARQRGAWLFSDEVYRGLEIDPATRAPAACDLYERAVSLGAMAKVYGLAGLRIGWAAIADATLFDEMAAFKDYLTICNSAPSELLSEVALRHHDRLVARTRATLDGNLALLDRFFQRHAERFDWIRPRAGTTALVGLRDGSATAFCADLVERAGVLLLPSSLFDAGDRHFRLGYGRANLPDALAALDGYLAS
jgi:aspartate/methionine/tyrosine aminotransferase